MYQNKIETLEEIIEEIERLVKIFEKSNPKVSIRTNISGMDIFKYGVKTRNHIKELEDLIFNKIDDNTTSLIEIKDIYKKIQKVNNILTNAFNVDRGAYYNFISSNWKKRLIRADKYINNSGRWEKFGKYISENLSKIDYGTTLDSLLDALDRINNGELRIPIASQTLKWEL